MEDKTTALALAKQLRYDCEDMGDITLSKATLRIILDAFIEEWTHAQVKVRQGFEKVK